MGVEVGISRARYGATNTRIGVLCAPPPRLLFPSSLFNTSTILFLTVLRKSPQRKNVRLQGAREMLRRAQPHQKQQQESSSSDSSSLAAPRSLEALLAENTVLSPAGAFPGGNGEQGGDGNGRRSSVSSDWSPPPSTTGGVGQPYHSSGGGSRRRRSFSDDDDGGGGGRGSATGAHTRSDERSDGETAAAVEAVAGGGGAGTETHSWGASSNPPTPARMYFEGRDTLLTPSGERSLAIAAGTGDRYDA